MSVAPCSSSNSGPGFTHSSSTLRPQGGASAQERSALSRGCFAENSRDFFFSFLSFFLHVLFRHKHGRKLFPRALWKPSQQTEDTKRSSTEEHADAFSCFCARARLAVAYLLINTPYLCSHLRLVNHWHTRHTVTGTRRCFATTGAWSVASIEADQ